MRKSLKISSCLLYIYIIQNLEDMGLLDSTPEIDNTIITKELVVDRNRLNFKGMPSLDIWFRKDIYIRKENFFMHCIALIQFPRDYEYGDDVKICINFHEGIRLKSNKKKIDTRLISPMTFKSNLYYTIEMFLSEENILRHLTTTKWDY